MGALRREALLLPQHLRGSPVLLSSFKVPLERAAVAANGLGYSVFITDRNAGIIITENGRTYYIYVDLSCASYCAKFLANSLSFTPYNNPLRVSF